MSTISFFTPVSYRDQPTFWGQKAVELVDGYFSLGGRVAVVIPGAVQNGSQEVALQDVNAVWWQTALKVVSYFTVVIPVIMLVAKAIMRSQYLFHECQRQPNVFPDPPYDMVVAKAPLTLVRSDGPANLDISVLYNQKFSPQDPIEPKPSEIANQGPLSKYTWKVLAHEDGTMTAADRRIKMIWWEAMRHEMPTRIDTDQAVCVERSELKGFLEKTLKKLGVQDKELGAFTHYWHEIFKNDYDAQNAPFVLVQLIQPDELGKYIPEMEVQGPDAGRFDLQRFYFRFEPTSNFDRGMNADVYLANLDEAQLGPNVVIDLGGEVADCPGVERVEWEGAEAFEQGFIREHIYAT